MEPKFSSSAPAQEMLTGNDSTKIIFSKSTCEVLATKMNKMAYVEYILDSTYTSTC